MYIFQILLFMFAIGTVPLTPVVSVSDEITTEKIVNVAAYGDAQHREHHWYSYDSLSDEDITDETDEEDAYSSIGTSDAKSEQSSDASSFETKEIDLKNRVYRTCTPCPHDMLKSYKNVGIKWICGGYQRARRSFKSECMMRYRNCQDGTLFIKLYDHRCRNDSYHGRHFFYHYRT